jgi:hypothetical protein
MTGTQRLLFLCSFLIGMQITSYSQQVTRIVIIDSATFKPLPAVFIQLKNTNRSVLVSPTGIINLKTNKTDTLLLSHIGYKPISIPLLFEEDAILIRMSEQITMLAEVTVKSRKLYPNEINPRKSITRSTAAGSIAVPWDYFSRREKDKRKVNALMLENDRIRTFVEVVTDPSIKEELMTGYNLSEDAYYNKLVKFNKQKLPVIYSNDADAIITALHDFFEANTGELPK